MYPPLFVVIPLPLRLDLSFTIHVIRTLESLASMRINSYPHHTWEDWPHVAILGDETSMRCPNPTFKNGCILCDTSGWVSLSTPWCAFSCGRIHKSPLSPGVCLWGVANHLKAVPREEYRYASPSTQESKKMEVKLKQDFFKPRSQTFIILKRSEWSECMGWNPI